jgi:RNA polymerase sigma factor (sigma-70 family)
VSPFAKAGRPANDVGVPGTGSAPRDELSLLALAAQAGDSKAIRTLLGGLGPAMLRVIRKILGESNLDVNDVLQDSMFGLVKALGGFRQECSVMHFACRVAVMTSLAARRQRRSRGWVAPVPLSSEVDLVPTPASDPATEAEAAARRTVLWRLLEDLPTTQAEALALHCVEGFTVEEIAAAESCPVETVKSRLRLAKATLRSRIAEDLTARDLLTREP